MMKKENVQKRINRINEEIDMLEKGGYCSGMSQYCLLGKERWCCDQIAWLAKFHYISDEEIEQLTGRMIRYFDRCSYKD